MKRRSTFVAFVALAGLSFGVAACGSSSDGASPSTGTLSADAAAGKTLLSSRCLGCHSIDGKAKTGPTFKGLAGSSVPLTGGTTVTADDAYLIESITKPSAKVVKGFPDIMSSAVPEGSLTAEQAKQIAAYIKTLDASGS